MLALEQIRRGIKHVCQLQTFQGTEEGSGHHPSRKAECPARFGCNHVRGK